MLNQEHVVIGKSLNKVEAVKKAKGDLKYSGDIMVPNCLHAKVLRSPHAHALVKSIDTTKADNLPGVHAVITHEDIPEISTVHNAVYAYQSQCFDSYILERKVRHVGDRVAAVAAETIEIAEEALDLISVEYEILPLVVDRIKTMKPGAPVIHEYVHRGDKRVDIRNNILASKEIEYGNVEKGFREADLIVENVYETSRANNAQLERSVITCCPGEGGRLDVYATTQGIHTLRIALAESLGIPIHLINVHRLYLGGSFGAHIHTGFIESICAFLAIKTQRPVRLEKTREEIFLSCGRHPETIRIKSGVKSDGTLIAHHMDLTDDTGAYATGAESKLSLGAGDFVSMYRCPNQKVTGRTVYTNTPPLTAMRGAGNPQVHFALESQMDIIAKKLGIDPAEIRLKNLIRVGDVLYGAGQDIVSKIKSNGTASLLKKGAEIINWKNRDNLSTDKPWVKRGIGVARGFHTSGCGSEKPSELYVEYTGAIVMFNVDGTVNLNIAAVDMGPGGDTALAAIAAEELGVPFEDVNVVDNDTSTSLFDCPTHASRNTYVVGTAVRKASIQAKEIIKAWAAKILEVPIELLETRNGTVHVLEKSDLAISIKDVVRTGHSQGWGTIMGSTSHRPREIAPHFTVCFCEVEVDTRTGEVRVVRVVSGADVGTVINRQGVEGQIEGGVHMGLGYALMEDTVIDDTTGAVLTTDFLNYKTLGPRDMPKIDTIIADTYEPSGPFGAKGCGEGVTNHIAPAVCNSIYSATGVRIYSLPATPEKILTGLRKLREEAK